MRWVIGGLAAIAVFAAVLWFMSVLLPEPHGPKDYFVMGAAATMAALCAVFGVVIRWLNLRDILFRRRG